MRARRAARPRLVTRGTGGYEDLGTPVFPAQPTGDTHQTQIFFLPELHSLGAVEPVLGSGRNLGCEDQVMIVSPAKLPLAGDTHLTQIVLLKKRTGDCEGPWMMWTEELTGDTHL